MTVVIVFGICKGFVLYLTTKVSVGHGGVNDDVEWFKVSVGGGPGSKVLRGLGFNTGGLNHYLYYFGGSLFIIIVTLNPTS